MNQYKKKKSFLQALFAFEWVQWVVIILAIIVVPSPIGALVMRLPYLSEALALEGVENRFFTFLWSYVCGMLVICTCGFVVLIAVVLKEFLEESMPHVVQGVMRDLRATKIMQYLPLSKEDWERFDVETDEDAIRVLRNLVKSVGFYDCLENCYELHGEIIASYHAFLTMKYGEWDVIFDIDDDVLVDANDLVLCSDEDFDAKLEAERKRSKEKREEWFARKIEQEKEGSTNE